MSGNLPFEEMTDEEIDREFRGIVYGIIMENGGPQEVAFELGMSNSHMANALNPKERHTFHPRHLFQLQCMKGGQVLVAFQARGIGRALVEVDPLTPEQDVICLRAAARESLGGDSHKGFIKTYRRISNELRGVMADGD